MINSQSLHKLLTYFFSGYRYQSQAIWFKNSLYILLLFMCAYWFAYYDLYFGSSSIVYSTHSGVGSIKNLAFLLYNSESVYLGAYYIAAVAVLCVMSLFLRNLYFIFDIVIWFFVLNIHNKIYPTLTGGNFLLNQFLFFNCFLSYRHKPGPGALRTLRMYLHNFSSLAIVIQLCVAYFLSALAKLGDANWIEGRAISQVFLTEHFSLYTIFKYGANWTPAYKLFNYLILFYQLLFPLLVWIKPVKKPFLIFGILMHLYISFVMGLVTFGIIMIIGYIYFWPMKRSVS